MKSQKGFIEPETAMVFAIFLVGFVLFVLVAYGIKLRADCVRDNVHRPAPDVQVVCGRA